MAAYYWSEEELKTLRDMASEGALPADVAAALGRSKRSVEHKLRSELGVRQPNWTRRDEYELMSLSEARKTMGEAAKLLGRSKLSVTHKARRMGISFAPGFSFNELAEHLGVEVSSVARWARDLGLRKERARQAKSGSLTVEEALVVVDGILSGRVGQNLKLPMSSVRAVQRDLQGGAVIPRRNPVPGGLTTTFVGQRSVEEQAAEFVSDRPWRVTSGEVANFFVTALANNWAMEQEGLVSNELIDPEGTFHNFDYDANKYIYLSISGVEELIRWAGPSMIDPERGHRGRLRHILHRLARRRGGKAKLRNTLTLGGARREVARALSISTSGREGWEEPWADFLVLGMQLQLWLWLREEAVDPEKLASMLMPTTHRLSRVWGYVVFDGPGHDGPAARYPQHWFSEYHRIAREPWSLVDQRLLQALTSSFFVALQAYIQRMLEERGAQVYDDDDDEDYDDD